MWSSSITVDTKTSQELRKLPYTSYLEIKFKCLIRLSCPGCPVCSDHYCNHKHHEDHVTMTSMTTMMILTMRTITIKTSMMFKVITMNHDDLSDHDDLGDHDDCGDH